MDRHTPEQRSKNMRAVKSKGSKIEKLLAKEMWAEGLRYRKNDKTVTGKPDFVFKGLKIAVFCDGEFWHGKNWDEKKNDIKTNTEFWIPKIEKNILRDIKVNSELTKQGWKVLRFWGKDIEKNAHLCMLKIKENVTNRRNEIHRAKEKN